MATVERAIEVADALAEIDTLADLVQRLGDVPLHRIRFRPAPGTATEADVLAAEAAPRKRLCELIDGTLVEKALGFAESLLASYLIRVVGQFVDSNKMGLVTGADGMLRLSSGNVRIPDVAFFSWDRLPGRRVPEAPIPQLAPDLAVEILSASNTPAEMTRKREEYFASGTRLVWEVDAARRAVTIYRGATDGVTLHAGDVLEGEDVLAGFKLSLAELFAELDQRG